ncbi:MAG: hypothetical protein U5O39_08475 [Gammaproteobacteria bacterium]|nr:hypothetical protein [Gammaproteobacteria bacterium]
MIRLKGSGSSVLNTGQVDASADEGEGRGGRINISSDADVVMAGDSRVTAASASDVGGTVEVSSNRIRMTDRASVDVSGATGGGDIAMAATGDSMLDAGTSLIADATSEGDGGTVQLEASNLDTGRANLRAWRRAGR